MVHRAPSFDPVFGSFQRCRHQNVRDTASSTISQILRQLVAPPPRYVPGQKRKKYTVNLIHDQLGSHCSWRVTMVLLQIYCRVQLWKNLKIGQRMPKLSLRPEWRIFVSQCRIPARCFPSHMADHCVFHYVCEPDRYGSIIRSGCMAAIRFSDYFVPLGLSFRLMYRTHTFFLWRMHGTERRTDMRSHVSAIIVEYDSRDNKRGAYWDRLCRDVGRWLVVTRVHCGQTVHPRPIVTMEH